MFIKKSEEDPNTIYVWFFGKRLIFRKNLKRPFCGWYDPNLSKVV